MDKDYSTYCCVPQCNNYGKPSLSFHYFPTDPVKRKQWVLALRIAKEPSAFMRVCGAHFVAKDYFPAPAGTIKKTRRLFPHAVPSQNIPKRTHETVISSPQKKKIAERADRLSKRNQFEGVGDQLQDDIDSVIENSSDEDDTQDDTCQFEPMEATPEDNKKLKEIGIQVDFGCEDHPPRFSLATLLTNEEQLYTFTGLRSFDLLDTIVECVADIDTMSKLKKRVLPLKDCVVLTFVKLKLNLSFAALLVLFGINRRTASKYFRHILPLVSKVLKTVIPWPDKEIIRNNLPLSFENFQSTPCVLDCAETSIEKCHCLRCRVMTYSQYKGRHTLKFLIVTAPSGLIIDISECYPGRASDKFITLDSGILDKLDFRDGVMVDKGFLIETECLERHLTIIRPPFLKDRKQLPAEEAKMNAEIARARVHVERAIQRLREFAFLSEVVPWEMIPYVNDALIVAAGIHNLSPLILNIDKF